MRTDMVTERMECPSDERRPHIHTSARIVHTHNSNIVISLVFISSKEYSMFFLFCCVASICSKDDQVAMATVAADIRFVEWYE